MVDLADRRQQLASAPVRIVRRADAHRGAILFYHGLGVGIADQTKELHSLAREGFVVIGVDNVGHGERRYADFETRFNDDNPELDACFLYAVEQTIEEIPRVVEAAIDTGLANGSRVGVCGISMGGFIAYGAPLADRRIVATTPILGSPRWKLDRPSSPDRHLDDFYPVALLAQNAGRDANVPPADARALHAALRPRYAEAPDRLAYVEFEDAEHFMPEEQWDQLWQNVVRWFIRFVG